MSQERIDTLERRVEELEKSKENAIRRSADDNAIVLELLKHLRKVDPECAENIQRIMGRG